MSWWILIDVAFVTWVFSRPNRDRVDTFIAGWLCAVILMALAS